MKVVSNLIYSVPPLFAELGRGLSGDIDCSTSGINSYSVDGSPYNVRPQAVIYPKNATDIKNVVSFAREYGMPVTARGKGTARTGGSLGEGIVLDMSRHFNQIRHINMLDHTITVDAGVTIKSLREKLRGWNMDVPVLTAQDDESTIGGLIATKSGTPTTFHHGTIREWVESLTVVVDTGEEHRIADGITPSGRLLGIYQAVFPILTESAPIIRANKPVSNDDATGYCVWNTSIGPRQLLDELVGSEGTLGIITTVTFRLSVHLPHSLTTCISINDVSKLSTYIDIAKHHHATHIFLYDSMFANLAEKYHAGLLPSFPETQYVLLVTHFGIDKEKLHGMARVFTKALNIKEGLIVHTEGSNMIEHVTKSSLLFSLLNKYTGETQVPVTLCDGLIVPLHKYGELISSVTSYMSSLGNPYVMTGNAGSGHLSVVAMFDPRSPTYEMESSGFGEAVFSFIKKHKGGISSTSGDGLARTPYLTYIYNEPMLSVFRKIKEAWDPKQIFNPGKKTTINMQYLIDHLQGFRK